jgi:hypothetical protein
VTPVEPISAFDVTLHWPVRIEAQGELYQSRSDNSSSPAKWLQSCADWIGKNGKWRQVTNPYAERFGTPCSYPEPRHPYQEFVYFHPFIQDLLYERHRPHSEMALLVRSDIRSLEIVLGSGVSLRFAIPRLQLYLFTTDVAVMVLELTEPQRFDLPSNSWNPTTLSLHEAMDVLNQIRRVYPPFWDDDDLPGECPLSIGLLDANKRQVGPVSDYSAQEFFLRNVDCHRCPPVAPHWNTLLHPLTPWTPPPRDADCGSLPTGLSFSQIADDRIPLQAYLACANPAAISDAEFMRLTFLDPGSSDWAYKPSFMAGKERDHWYDRFWHYDTRYLISGYSFVAVTRQSEFAETALRVHMRHHYCKLFLLAQMQKASLLVAWDRLAALTRKFGAESASDASRERHHRDHQWLAADFASYLAIFEFSEVTNVLQGRELFALMRRHLGSAELLRELREQMEFAGNADRNYHSEKLSAAQVDLTKLANRWIPFSLALAAASLWFSTFGADWLRYRPAFVPVTPWSSGNYDWQSRWVLIAAVTGLLIVAIKRIFDWISGPQPTPPDKSRLWILPVNDLESHAIRDLLNAAGQDCIQTEQGWGARWTTLAPSILERCQEFREAHPDGTIYGIELAGPNPFDAIDIDHHRYSGEDRTSQWSSLEQVAAILKIKLNREQQLVAINDRAWIPGLLAAGISWPEITAIRERDRRVQGVTPDDEAQAHRDLITARRDNGVWIVECPLEPRSAHTDFLAKREGEPQPALLKGPKSWCYSGPQSGQLGSQAWPETHWSGGGYEFGFFGIENPGAQSRKRIAEILGLAP